MSRTHNILFVFLIGFVLFLALGNGFVRVVTYGQDAQMESHLEGRYYQNIPNVTPERFSSHAVQDEAEQYFADSLPKRDSILLVNAGAQRMLIAFANAPFGFPAYASFFGSEYVCCPGYNAIVEWPISRVTATPELLTQRAEAIKRVTEKYKSTEWCMALVDRSRISIANPAHSLVSNAADYQYYLEEFAPIIEGSCHFIDLSITSPEDYFAKYFHTDHHWQVTGALEAYGKLMGEFGRKPDDLGQPNMIYGGPFFGSEARSGLCTAYSDVVYDVSAPSDGYTITVDGKRESLAWLNPEYGEKDHGAYNPSERFGNAYRDLFHRDCGELHITNKHGKGTLLIVGDSFTNNVDRLFATAYRDVYVIDPRHFAGTLEHFMKEHAVDDAVFLMASNTLLSNSFAQFLSQ